MSFLELTAAEQLKIVSCVAVLLLLVCIGLIAFHKFKMQVLCHKIQSEKDGRASHTKWLQDEVALLHERLYPDEAAPAIPPMPAPESGGKLGGLLLAVNRLVGKLDKIEGPLAAAVGALPAGTPNKPAPTGIIDEIGQTVAIISDRLDVLGSQARLLQ